MPKSAITAEDKSPKPITIDDTILLSKIHDLRFMDDNGRFYRLADHITPGSGLYMLVDAE